MSKLRTRAVRSSSHGELGVFNQSRPVECLFEIKKRPAPVINEKPREHQQPPRRVLWTLGSPESQSENESEREGSVFTKKKKKKIDEGFGGFLKACSLCKKKLLEAADVYMYGYLSAFCSPECRDDQIVLDGFDKEVSKEPTRMTMGGMILTKDASRRGFGTNRFK